jgi:hypothetical protein
MQRFLYVLVLLLVALTCLANARFVPPPKRRRGRRLQESGSGAGAAGSSASTGPKTSLSGGSSRYIERGQKNHVEPSGIDVWKSNKAKAKMREKVKSSSKLERQKRKKGAGRVDVEVGPKGKMTSAKKKARTHSAIGLWKKNVAKAKNTQKPGRHTLKTAKSGKPQAANGMSKAPPPKVYVDHANDINTGPQTAPKRDEQISSKKKMKKPSALDLWKKKKAREMAASSNKKW